MKEHLKKFWVLYLLLLLLTGTVIAYFFWWLPDHKKIADGTFCIFKNTDGSVAPGRTLNGVCSKMEAAIGATAPGFHMP